MQQAIRSAVQCFQHAGGLFFFLCGAGGELPHHAALLAAGGIVNGEILAHEEIGIAAQARLADQTEFGADCINCDGIEILDRGNDRLAFFFFGEHDGGADLSADVGGAGTMAIRTADDGIAVAVCAVFVIAVGLEAVLLIIPFAAEHLERIEIVIFHEQVGKVFGRVIGLCDPVGMREDRKSVGFSDLLIDPFCRGVGNGINAVGNIELRGFLFDHFVERIKRHHGRAFSVKRTEYGIFALFADRFAVKQSVDAVCTAEIDDMLFEVPFAVAGQVDFLTGHAEQTRFDAAAEIHGFQ